MLIYLFTTYMQKLFNLGEPELETRGLFAFFGFFETVAELVLLIMFVIYLFDKRNNSKVSNSTGLKAENERLKKQLNDYEKALKDYADGYNYAYVDNGFAFYSNQYSNEGLAQEVLEKWEVK